MISYENLFILVLQVSKVINMRRFFYARIKSIIRKLGFDLVRYPALGSDELKMRIFNSVKSYTITSPEKISALIDATKYIAKQKIDGAFVECGVWKGGSVMTMALTLKETGDLRDIYLYDTFSGMVAPSDVDGELAMKAYSKSGTSGSFSKWLCSPVEEVQKNIFETGYPKDKLNFVKGRVEDTIPGTIPEKIALLRLDTDFYESTKHELKHLFPILSPGGIIIIDDYGTWQGARKAVDEYIEENKVCIFLNRIDSEGRIAVKMPD